MSHVYTCVTESKQETQQITDCCILMQGKNNVWGKAMMGPGQNSKTVSVVAWSILAPFDSDQQALSASLRLS